MTKDTSPENLRKFLESDDPAMVRMGLSMAKGAGVEVTVKDLEHFLKSEDVETIKTGVMLADEAGIGDEAMVLLCENLKSDEQKAVIDTIKKLGEIGDTKAVNPLILKLNDYNRWICSRSADALGKIGDTRAVKPLISMLKSTRKMTYNSSMDNPYYAAAKALDALKWEPEKDEDLVFYLLITQGSELPTDAVALDGLGYIRIDNQNPLVKLGKSAVEHLIKALESGDRNACEIAVRTLCVIRDTRAVEALIKALEVIDRVEFFRQYGYWELGDWKGMFNAVVETLVEFGDNRAVSPFVEALDRNSVFEGLDTGYHGLFTVSIVEALMKIGIDTITESERSVIGSHLRIMLEIITDEEGSWNPDVFDVWTTMEWICEIGPAYCSRSGSHFCELLIQTLETFDQTQLLIKIMEESRGIYRKAAAEALDGQGWQPVTDELRANYLVATEQWVQCSNLGASAVEPLIRELEYAGEGEYEEEEYDDALEPIARVLGEIGDARAVEPLLTLLSGSYGDVRRAATEALGDIGELAIPPLIKVLRDKEHHIAAETLDRIARTSTNALAFEPFIETLTDMLKNRDIRIRQAIANILENIGWEPKTDELRVVYLLAKGDVKGFVEWGEPVVEYLIEALSDKIAMLALGEIGDERAVEPLIRALEGHNENAAKALGMIGDVRAVEPLINKVLEDGDDIAAAVEALGEIGDARAVEPLIKALEDEDYDVRWHAVWALERIGDARAVDPLIKTLEGDNWEVRKSAAEALVVLDWKPETNGQRVAYLIALQDWKSLVEWGEPAMEVLIKLFEGGNSNAAWALGKIGNPRAIEPLVKALGDEDENVRWSAASALGEIGDERVVEPLIKALSDKPYTIESGYFMEGGGHAARALEMVGKPAVEPLINVLGESDIRWHAAGVLDRLGWKPETNGQRAAYLIAVQDWKSLVEWGEPAVEPLIKLIRDEDKDVHRALEALIEIGEPAIQPLVKALDDEDIRNSAARILDRLGWKDDYGIWVSTRLLDSSGLKLSPEKQKEIEGVCAKLLPKEKIMNLEQEEFAEIIRERSKSLETMQDPCTAEDIIGLLSGSSAQARWIVACGVVEISCYDSATIDKILENPINIFWSEISTYTDLITKADRDEIVKVLRSLPPTLLWKISNGLMDFAIAKGKERYEASEEVKKNRKMVTTIFEDAGLAKIMWSGMS